VERRMAGFASVEDPQYVTVQQDTFWNPEWAPSPLLRKPARFDLLKRKPQAKLSGRVSWGVRSPLCPRKTVQRHYEMRFKNFGRRQPR
jgi:hypothetical protein